MRSAPLNYEIDLWDLGIEHMAGLDEVGKGAFSGPIVCGCVVFPRTMTIPIGIRIDDSKKLTSLQRIKAARWIKKNALAWGIGHTATRIINTYGITKATELSFVKAFENARRRLKNHNKLIQYLLIDAFSIKSIDLPQKPIIKGDSQSFSIAASSILAKVYRDAFMINLSKKRAYNLYAWHKNKGYGSLEHTNAILMRGITDQHRLQYVKTFLSKKDINFDSFVFQSQSGV